MKTGKSVGILAVIVGVLVAFTETVAAEAVDVGFQKAYVSPTFTQKVEIKPEGPCDPYFNPEACPDIDYPRAPEGCTQERIDTIASVRSSYPHWRVLGAATSDYEAIDEGCKKDYEGGSIYVTYSGSSKVVCGPIRDLYVFLGETASDLGWPQSHRAELPHNTGIPGMRAFLPSEDLRDAGYDFEALEHRYQFAEGWVYWRPGYADPHIVMDWIHDRFQAEGGTPELGFPLNDEGPDSHEGDTLFQAFDRGLIFENIHGSLEVFRDDMLDAYLDGATRSVADLHLRRVGSPLEAETELGLPNTDYMPTPSGSVRILHRGTIYYGGDSASPEVFPKFIAMLDGRVVHPETIDADTGTSEMIRSVEEDPYLADYRKDVVLEALSHVGFCGDRARDRIGTISTEYCSEFVREVYLAAGIDHGLWGGGIFITCVTYAKQLRWIFQHESRFVYSSRADLLTPEPGDYISALGESHSALVIATSIDGSRLWKVGGNEGSRDCVRFTDRDYLDEHGIVDDYFTGFGKLRGSFF